MDYLTLTAEIIKSLAWPVTTIFIVLLFRKPLTSLLENIRGFEYKDLKVNFGKKLDELEIQVKELPALQPSRAATGLRAAEPHVSEFEERIDRLASISPRAAITEAFRELELAMREHIRHKSKSIPKSTRELISLIVEDEPDMGQVLDNLRRLRNVSNHAKDIDLTSDQAILYGQLVTQLISVLNSRR